MRIEFRRSSAAVATSREGHRTPGSSQEGQRRRRGRGRQHQGRSKSSAPVNCSGYSKDLRCGSLFRPSARPKATNRTMPVIIPTSSAVVIISIISSVPSRQTMGRSWLDQVCATLFAGMCELLHTWEKIQVRLNRVPKPLAANVEGQGAKKSPDVCRGFKDTESGGRTSRGG